MTASTPSSPSTRFLSTARQPHSVNQYIIHTFYYNNTYMRSCNKNKIVPGRIRTSDISVNSRILLTAELQRQYCPHLESNQRPPHYKCGALPLSYKGRIRKKMREAGFEPAHPEIVGLKSTALDHSAIRAQHYFFGFCFFWKGVPPPTIFQRTSLSYFK